MWKDAKCPLSGNSSFPLILFSHPPFPNRVPRILRQLIEKCNRALFEKEVRVPNPGCFLLDDKVQHKSLFKGHLISSPILILRNLHCPRGYVTWMIFM